MKVNNPEMNGSVSLEREGGGMVRLRMTCFSRSSLSNGPFGRSLGWSVIYIYIERERDQVRFKKWN